MILKSLENRALFKGHVVVEQGTMVLQADDVLLVLKEREKGSSIPSGFSLLSPQQNHEIEKIEAKGHVVFHEGNRRARSERAEYFREKGVVVLTGEPEVWEGDSHVTGSKITILLHERRSIVEQSRMVLHPQ
jgi:lipopolysaccharide export system protein LptA